MARKKKKEAPQVAPDDTTDPMDGIEPTQKDGEWGDDTRSIAETPDPAGPPASDQGPEDAPDVSNIGNDDRLSEEEKKVHAMTGRIRAASDDAQEMKALIRDLKAENPDCPETQELCERLSQKTLGEPVRAVCTELEVKAKRERLEQENPE